MRNPKAQDIVTSQALKICSIEDDDVEFATFETMLNQYFGTRGREIVLVRYKNGDDFLREYQYGYDLIFMDIMLEDSNGMKTAEKLRLKDKEVVLIFLTKMAQFAVKGYQVNALDFLVKPYTYEELSFRLNHALTTIGKRHQKIAIKTRGGVEIVPTEAVYFIDVYGHSLGFHTQKGTIYAWGSLSDYEKELSDQGFLRSNNSTLVNARHIAKVVGLEVLMANKIKISISHPRKKAFMEALAMWAGYQAL